MSLPTHGTLALNADGSFTYQPSSGYIGPDSFTYRARDGVLESNVATVSLTIADTTVPAAPMGMTATGSATGILVDWADNSEPDLAGCNIYRSSSASGPFTELNSALVVGSTFDDTAVLTGTAHYKITAVDTSQNESPQSAAISAATPTANRIANPSFELDSNGDTRPDNWSGNADFTRSNVSARTGGFAGRHASTGNVNYTINQVVSGLTAGTTYTAAGWVNISSTTDAFAFRIRCDGAPAPTSPSEWTPWRSTPGWVRTPAPTLVAPLLNANDQVLLVVASLNAAIYLDDLALR